MRTLFASLLMASIPAIASAQIPGATTKTKRNKKNDSLTWKIDRHVVEGRIGRKELHAMKDKAAQLTAFFKDSCFDNVLPVKPHIAAVYGPHPDKVSLHLDWKELSTQCDITSNDLSSVLEPISINSKEYFQLRVTPTQDNNLWMFELEDNTRDIQTKIWMLTDSEDAAPYLPVTKLEYLKDAKAELSLTEQEMITEIKEILPVRSKEEQERWKQSQLDELKRSYSGASLDIRTRMFLEKYQTDEKLQQEAIEARTADVKSRMQYLDSLMTNMKQENLQAATHVMPGTTEFNGFNEGPGSRILVKRNPKYFPPDVTTHTATFLVMTCMYKTSERFVIDKLRPRSVSGTMNLLTRVP